MDPSASVFFDLADEIFAVVDRGGRVSSANRRWTSLGLPDPSAELVRLVDVVDGLRGVEIARLLALEPGQCATQTLPLKLAGGVAEMRVRVRNEGGTLCLAAREHDGRRRVPTDQPQLADKLQSMGELAAGIAHEINTPIQFVSNNLDFLEQAFCQMLDSIETSRRTIEMLGDACPEVVRRIHKRADLGLLVTEVPCALGETIAGVRRITEIVRAMNEFTHPQNDDRRLVDIHKLLETAVAMSQSAWKYVAEVQLELDEGVPLVPAFGSGIGQVFINLIINAVHAIEESAPSGRKGTIKISTAVEPHHVRITVADSGCGMSANVQEQIFDPFFTTKSHGKGTGQGLAIAYREITERHGGSLDVVSAPGSGTEFHIALPLRSDPRSAVKEIAS